MEDLGKKPKKRIKIKLKAGEAQPDIPPGYQINKEKSTPRKTVLEKITTTDLPKVSARKADDFVVVTGEAAAKNTEAAKRNPYQSYYTIGGKETETGGGKVTTKEEMVIKQKPPKEPKPAKEKSMTIGDKLREMGENARARREGRKASREVKCKTGKFGGSCGPVFRGRFKS